MPTGNPDETLDLSEAVAIIKRSERPVLQTLWPMLLVWGLASIAIGTSLAVFGTERPSRIVLSVVLLTCAVASALVMQIMGWGIYGPVLGRIRTTLAFAVAAMGAIGLATALVSAPTVAGVPTVRAASVAALAVGMAWAVVNTLTVLDRRRPLTGILWVIFCPALLAAYIAAPLPLGGYILIASGVVDLIGAIPTRANETRPGATTLSPCR